MVHLGCFLFLESSQLEAHNKAESRKKPSLGGMQVGWASKAAGFLGIGGDVLGPHVPKVGSLPLTHKLKVHRTMTEVACSHRHILEGQPHLSPGEKQLLHKVFHHLRAVVGRRCQAQELLTPRHSWVVDGLHIDAVLGEQKITDLAVECCITHLGSKERPFSTLTLGSALHTSSMKQLDRTRTRDTTEFADRLFCIKGLGSDGSRISIKEEPRASNEI